MKIDEYVPEATPTSKTVDRPVISDRVRTSLIERLTICENAARGSRGSFSRIRSNTITVSYIEYPRMVRKAATVALVTSRSLSEYTPAVIRMSWTSAISTGTAYLGWKRIAT